MAAPRADPAPLTRKCRVCNQDKRLAPGEWPYVYGKPAGQTCRACVVERKDKTANEYVASVEASRRHSAKVTKQKSTPSQGTTAMATTGDKPKALAAFKKREVEEALNAGASLLNEHSKEILERVILYATDDSNPHHEWAIKLLAERIMPTKLYSGIGEQTAGVGRGEKEKQRPNVYIQVMAAPQAGGGIVTVVEAEPESLEDLL